MQNTGLSHEFNEPLKGAEYHNVPWTCTQRKVQLTGFSCCTLAFPKAIEGPMNGASATVVHHRMQDTAAFFGYGVLAVLPSPLGSLPTRLLLMLSNRTLACFAELFAKLHSRSQQDRRKVLVQLFQGGGDPLNGSFHHLRLLHNHAGESFKQFK